jgi:hypothetical protein
MEARLNEPKIRHPEQADGWKYLIFAYIQPAGPKRSDRRQATLGKATSSRTSNATLGPESILAAAAGCGPPANSSKPAGARPDGRKGVSLTGATATRH